MLLTNSTPPSARENNQLMPHLFKWHDLPPVVFQHVIFTIKWCFNINLYSTCQGCSLPVPPGICCYLKLYCLCLEWQGIWGWCLDWNPGRGVSGYHRDRHSCPPPFYSAGLCKKRIKSKQTFQHYSYSDETKSKRGIKNEPNPAAKIANHLNLKNNLHNWDKLARLGTAAHSQWFSFLK